MSSWGDWRDPYVLCETRDGCGHDLAHGLLLAELESDHPERQVWVDSLFHWLKDLDGPHTGA